MSNGDLHIGALLTNNTQNKTQNKRTNRRNRYHNTGRELEFELLKLRHNGGCITHNYHWRMRIGRKVVILYDLARAVNYHIKNKEVNRL